MKKRIFLAAAAALSLFLGLTAPIAAWAQSLVVPEKTEVILKLLTPSSRVRRRSVKWWSSWLKNR